MLPSWEDISEASANLHSFCPFRNGLGIALSSYRNAGTMPEELVYLLLTVLFIVSGFIFLRIVRSRKARHRKTRRLEREIAKHFLQKGGTTK